MVPIGWKYEADETLLPSTVTVATKSVALVVPAIEAWKQAYPDGDRIGVLASVVALVVNVASSSV